MSRTYADVESVFISWLLANTTDINCVVELPVDLGEPDKDPVVQVKRIGGIKRSPNLELPTVDVDCFHYTRAQASDLVDEISALLVRQLPGSYMDLNGVRASISEVVELAGTAEREYNNPNVVRFGFAIQAIIKSSTIP